MMKVEHIVTNGVGIAKIYSQEILLSDVDSALDLMATVRHQTGCSNMLLNREAIAPEFFDLSSRIAGTILQKFVTYQMRLAIVGDFSSDSSRSLKAFIAESNRGREIYFASDEEKALKWLNS